MCSFSTKTSRKSQGHHASTRDEPNSFVASNDGSMEDRMLPQSDIQLSADGTSDVQPILGNANYDAQSSTVQNLISPGSTGWPWLHENIFLQTDFNLDWFDIQMDQAIPDVQGHNDSLDSSGDPGPQVATEAPGQRVSARAMHTSNSITPEDVASLDRSRSITVDALVENASAAIRSQQEIFYNEVDDLSHQIVSKFDLNDLESLQGPHPNHDKPLGTFVQLYLEHFWQLWPLCSRYQFDSAIFEPLFYLAMASIGAMYSGRKGSVFGTMLHNRLRDELINPLLDIDLPQDKMLPLGQARALTQAAALYFGQKRAFSFAHHLGGALVAQARRMNLFSQTSSHADENYALGSASTWIDHWLRMENRKVLAFAILRLEMYTSVLHSTRPLVSAKEINLHLPCSRYLWLTSFNSTDVLAAAIRQENSTDKHEIIFCDLARIAIEPREDLPHIAMLPQELLMNAMQEQVWEACAAKASLERLKPEGLKDGLAFDSGIEDGNPAKLDHALDLSTPSDNPLFANASIDSQLAQNRRKMASMRLSIQSSIAALKKCRSSVLRDSSRLSNILEMSVPHRSSLLSCLLTYHLGFLQLNAPLDTMHKICHLTSTNNEARRDASLRQVSLWASSRDACVAVRHSTTIYSLLRSETLRAVGHRASVNFLTMIGLYHSAVVTWVYAHARDAENGNESLTPAAGVLNVQSGFDQPSANAKPSMEDFLQVFHDITPAWAARSSFSEAIMRLSKTPNPFKNLA